MPGGIGTTQCEIDLRPSKYQSSLQAFRALIDSPSKAPYLFVAVRTPKDEAVAVQVRREDIYVIAFEGADDWYTFDDQKGGLGKSCGVDSNYTKLPTVGNVTLSDLVALGDLSRFKKKGMALDTRLLPILFAVVSEAARFATAATFFTGITNGIVPGGMNFEMMRKTYFNNWEKPPELQMEPGQVYHPVKPDILVPRHR
jgi:hypothetical protein